MATDPYIANRDFDAVMGAGHLFKNPRFCHASSGP